MRPRSTKNPTRNLPVRDYDGHGGAHRRSDAHHQGRVDHAGSADGVPGRAIHQPAHPARLRRAPSSIANAPTQRAAARSSSTCAMCPEARARPGAPKQLAGGDGPVAVRALSSRARIGARRPGLFLAGGSGPPSPRSMVLDLPGQVAASPSRWSTARAARTSLPPRRVRAARRQAPNFSHLWRRSGDG